MDFLISLLRDLGIGFLIPGTFFSFFWLADKNVHPRLRKRLSAFLLAKRKPRDVSNIATSFIAMMDVIFGPRAISVRFMLRSFAASLVCFFTMLGIYTILNPSSFSGWWGTESLIMTLLAGAICNLLPDYVSVMESRLMIARMRAGRISDVVFCFLFDFFLTTAIGFIAIIWYLLFFPLLYEMVVGRYWDDSSRLVTEVWRIYPYALLLDDDMLGLFGIIIYTTYLTSVWVWLYAIAVILLKSRGLMRPLRKILPVKKRPFRSVGIAIFFPSILVALVLGRMADALTN